MPYIERYNGVIVGRFACPQPGMAEEYLPDDHPDLFAPRVPAIVTMRQACQALILAGLMDSVKAAFDAMPGQQGDLDRSEWERSQFVERDRPLVLSMAAQLGLTSAQLDQLFITAGSF